MAARSWWVFELFGILSVVHAEPADRVVGRQDVAGCADHRDCAVHGVHPARGAPGVDTADTIDIDAVAAVLCADGNVSLCADGDQRVIDGRAAVQLQTDQAAVVAGSGLHLAVDVRNCIGVSRRSVVRVDREADVHLAAARHGRRNVIVSGLAAIGDGDHLVGAAQVQGVGAVGVGRDSRTGDGRSRIVLHDSHRQ